MDDAVAGVMARPISHYLYPERRPELAGRPLDLDALNAELTETDNCQPALFAVGFALTKLLGAVGVKPAVVAGHSVGEFTAAAVAGLTSPDEGIRWCARRGQGMQALGGDKGGMAAIVAEPSIVATVLAEGAVIANINHPRQVVISGFTEAVRKTVENARAKGLEVTELRVSHGFHSGVFAKLDLDSTVDAIAFSDGHVPVASCIDPATYTDSATARDVYKRHARSPVDWVGALQRCRDAGADLFLQIAAGGPLLSFVRGTLPGVPALTLASRDDTDHGASLLEGLGQLFVHGVDLDLDAITAHEPVASLPPSILPREHYWVVANRAVDAAPDFGRKLAVATESPAPARTVTETPPRSVTPAPAPAAAAPAAGVDPKVDIVFAAVAKASAYPRAALRATMKLGDDLGFDSMMVADFTEELRKQIPGFPGIPQDVLVNQPTIQSIVDYVLSPAASEAAPVAATTEDQAPLRAFRPVPTPSPLPLASLSRPLVPGRFHRSGPPANAASPSPGQLVAERLVALGWKEVCEVSAANPDKGLDLVIVDGFDAGPTPPVSAVLAGEAVAPADRIDALAAIMRGRFASSRQTAGFDLLHLHASDDVWAAGVAGFVRSVAREWPARVVRNISMTKGISSADALIDELRSHDRTVDLMYRPEGRAVVGLESTETASAWRPEPGEKVVITGGTRGIGFKLAQRLAEAGARVVVVGRTHPHGTVPPNIDVCLADLTDTAAIKATLGSHAGATTLIHAAGLLADGPLGQVGPEVAAAAWRVKVDGLLGSIAALGGSLVRVVAIGSWAGRFGNRHQAFYGAANAQMAALVAALPERFAASVAEFGPWTDSDMVRSIPPAIQAAMRADGVDFVADEAGLLALMQDLGQRGVIVHGRRLTTDLHLGERSETLDVATHTFLKDHAIAGVPVFPLASATTFLAETAAVAEPFEINDLRLFQGIQVTTPRVIEARVRGARAELFQRAPEAGATPVLSYQATIQRAPTTSTLPPAAPIGGEAPSLPLAAFYGGITFHGPLLQGITAIEAVGRDFVRGRVRTSRPANWIQGSAASAWAVDPLAFDAAMQLAAYVAWVRWSRAGTPIGFDRFVQLERWPEGEVRVDARFEDREADTLSANIVFRSADGARVIAFAEGVRADMRKVERQVVEKAAPAPTPAAKPFEVKAEWVDPAKFKGYKDISMRLQAVKAMGLKNPYFDLHEGTARNTSVIAGHEVINYSSYNYLGLSGDPRVIAEVEAAIRKYGTSVSASRVASGERPFHRDLEAALARAHGCEDALVMAGGHATNVNTIGHLFNSKDLILHDELIHDSCLQGIKLSGAARRSFRHEDIAHLEQQLEELRPHYEKVLILVEGVYSMDGDITNLPEYIRLKRKHGCLLMVDEAHSFGTIGATGCGVGEHFGLDEVPPRDGLNRKDVDIWMGTMSKSLASMGGWVAGRKELILYLRYTTPGFVFAAGIPPALGQAALSSLNYMLAEPWRVRNLQHNSKRFWQLLHERGLDTGPSHGDSPVIPVITGDSMWALKLSERLLEQGINAKPIIFPAVANDAARLRFFMTSLHTEEQLVYTADTIQQTLAAIRAESNQPKKR
jgi:7-keto-8-aminopelargonate synthetase-like enzyme/malonyl CoA-acyl carrier protein transacylase/NAD(P)-dependent dehydrogenase (short-subunit alcohol dehydrogenase family)